MNREVTPVDNMSAISSTVGYNPHHGLFPQRSAIEISEILERLSVMRKQECIYRVDDYLQNVSQQSTNVDAWCRSKMVLWCYSVIDYVSFNRETVLIAISYLDRFISTGSDRARVVVKDRREYQLAAMTSLYMAIKLFEPKKINMECLAELSRGSYTSSDLSGMESDMLFDLKWHLNCPTAVSFLEHYVLLLPVGIFGTAANRALIMENARYEIELSVTQYNLVTQAPSNVAVAALINSIQITNSIKSLRGEISKIMKSIQFFIGIDPYDSSLGFLISRMHNLRREQMSVLSKRSSPIISVPTKYEQTKVQVPSQPQHASGGHSSPNSCIAKHS